MAQIIINKRQKVKRKDAQSHKTAVLNHPSSKVLIRIIIAMT
jgi:hypothetical protein